MAAKTALLCAPDVKAPALVDDPAPYDHWTCGAFPGTTREMWALWVAVTGSKEASDDFEAKRLVLAGEKAHGEGPWVFRVAGEVWTPFAGLADADLPGKVHACQVIPELAALGPAGLERLLVALRETAREAQQKGLTVFLWSRR